MATTYYAAIDATDPVTGAVYGIGTTPSLARWDAGAGLDAIRVVPCTPAAAEHVREHGGAPSPLLSVSSRGVCLRSEEG